MSANIDDFGDVFSRHSCESSRAFNLLMLAVEGGLDYNRGHKGRTIMALLGGWRLTRTGALFVIGILVLGGLVTGGVFLVKNHGEAVRRDQAVKIAEQNLEDKSKEVSTPIATTPEASQPDTTKPGQTSTPGTHTGTDTTVVASAGAAQLPQTGVDAVQGIQQLAVVTILALSVAFYVSSRRAAAHL